MTHTTDSAVPRGGHARAFAASMSHALQRMTRRRRLLLALIITVLPVAVPLITSLLSRGQFAADGREMFLNMAESLHIDMLAPLLALFFAAALVGDEIENQTIGYILTRPVPRGAWVLGRFTAYLIIGGALLSLSMVLTFAAATPLAHLAFDGESLGLLLHYLLVSWVAVLLYGAFAVWLGAVTTRHVVIGVAFLYGWQKMATVVPGVVDFLTFQKYTAALLPLEARPGATMEIQTAFGVFDRAIYAVDIPKATAVIALLVVVFLAATIRVVLKKEFSGGRAVGS